MEDKIFDWLLLELIIYGAKAISSVLSTTQNNHIKAEFTP